MLCWHSILPLQTKLNWFDPIKNRTKQAVPKISLMLLLPISIAILRSVVPFHTHSCEDHWVIYNFFVGRAAMKCKLAAVPIPILEHDVTVIYGSVPSVLDYKACQESFFPFLGFFILWLQKLKLVLLMHIQRMNSDNACLWE